MCTWKYKRPQAEFIEMNFNRFKAHNVYFIFSGNRFLNMNKENTHNLLYNKVVIVLILQNIT